MELPKKILIQECCPRDGWQNHTAWVETSQKIAWIKKMIDCGAKRLEITSFVNSNVMPQMADAGEVFEGIRKYAEEKNTELTALVLNEKGIDRARDAGVETIEFVLSASEEHNLRNSHRTIAESMAIFKELALHSEGLRVILCLPCAFGSPFGDEVPVSRLKQIVETAYAFGVKEFGLADTAGISTPIHTREVLRYLADYMDLSNVSVHFHDTQGMGVANAWVALEEGIVRYDTALAGLGGCPFAPGAKGNIATEDFVNMCQGMGIETGFDLNLLLETARDMCQEIGAVPGGSLVLSCERQ